MENRHQAWLNVAASAVITMMALGLVSHAGTLFVEPVTREMGFSRAQFNMSFTITSLTGIGISLSLGWLYRRVKRVRVLLTIGILSAFTGQMFLATAQNIYFVYLGGLFRGGAVFYLSSGPYAIMTGEWFQKKRATAYGFILAGSGVGGVVFSPLTNYWITTYGWRMAYAISAVLVLSVCMLMLLFIRDKPGIETENKKPPEKGGQEKPHPVNLEDGMMLKEALNSSTFWLAAPGIALIAMTIFSVYVNTAAHLVHLQLHSQTVAWAISIVFLVNTVAKLFLGVVADRLGVRPIFYFSMGCFLISVGLLLFAANVAIAFAAAFFFGFGFATLSVPIPELVRHLFGGKDFSNMLGVIMTCLGIGGAIGPVAGGILFDYYDSYRPMLVAVLFLNLLSVLLITLSMNQARKHYEKKAIQRIEKDSGVVVY